MYRASGLSTPGRRICINQFAALCAELRGALGGCWRALLRLLTLHRNQLAEKQLAVYWDALAASLAWSTHFSDDGGDFRHLSAGTSCKYGVFKEMYARHQLGSWLLGQL